MAEHVLIRVNGREVRVSADVSLAAALLALGETAFRRSATGSPRGPVCGMGICYECRVTVNGVPQVRACMQPVTAGLDVICHV